MNKASLLALTLIATLFVCACAARRKAVKALQEDYPYQNAIEYRKANQKPVVADKKGFPLPPKPAEEQNAALIFPGNYTPETGKGRAVLQKLLKGDYYFQASMSYGNSASTFEGVCYQIDSKLICPIDYDIDEDFNPVEAYIELEQINPGELRLAAHYTLPGLFGQGLPELYRRNAAPARKPGSFVKPLGQAQAPVVTPTPVTTQVPLAAPAVSPASPASAPSAPTVSPAPALPRTSAPDLAAPRIQETAPAPATIQAPPAPDAPEIQAGPSAEAQPGQ